MENRVSICSESSPEESHEERQQRIEQENIELSIAARILSEEYGFKMEEKDWEDVRNGNGLVYGFDMKIDRVRELRNHCMSDNFPSFLEGHLVPLMSSWRKKYTNASEGEFDQALRTLLEIASKDFTYGRVDKRMPSNNEKRQVEEDLFNEKMTDEEYKQRSDEYYKKYIETQENMAKQLADIIKQVRNKVLQIEGKGFPLAA